MPRVVSDQRAKFENDELFRKLSRESEVRYTGYRDRPLEERQVRFQASCREGHADIGFVSTGTNLPLSFLSNAWSENKAIKQPTREFVDFEREVGKRFADIAPIIMERYRHSGIPGEYEVVAANLSGSYAFREIERSNEDEVHLKSQFIMNGVCVRWRGWLDLHRLDGIGCVEYDEERAMTEDVVRRDGLEEQTRRLREFEDRQKRHREELERAAEAEMEARRRVGHPDTNPCSSGASVVSKAC